MADSNLTQLNNIYESPGWKHIEKYLTTEISMAQEKILKGETPENELIFARAKWAALQGFLDKVEADKSNYREQTKA